MFSSPRRWIIIVSPFLTLTLLYCLLLTPKTDVILDAHTPQPWLQSDRSYIVIEGTQQPQSDNHPPEIMDEETQCGHLTKDLNDVFVILKTGATEALQKVPTQLRTGLQCVPHYAVFSDYEEIINGVRTYDVLNNITQSVMDKEPEFEYYRQLQKEGRQGLTAQDWGDDTNGPFGKDKNPGWKLDKWKFLPMVDEALELMPDAKWYVFIEADTYIVWQNLVNWLAHLDHTQPFYLGSPMQIGEVLFGYGGAGVILSHETVSRLSQHRSKFQEKLEKITASEWAGDCVLARALEETKIPLTWAWPMMMTSRPWQVDHFSEAYGHQPWCFPVISYHHMSPRDIEEFWRFDRQWFKSGKNALMLHADVYREFIHNGSLAYRDYWDNLSGADIIFDSPTTPSVDSCADACEQNSECLQYAYNHDEGSCKHASTTFAGITSNNTSSGWITHRVQRLLRTFQSSCDQVEYIL
ncbi:hypothetical protein N7495_001879 [Penicillium taxi]|uniref:uncharacterized protein n=1 Tax=Penicillium taxi TaxID=168475 RepID=UPI0025452986|nr:uncharacterized protein N7495_001879 [Penicillium taxi]KAJ5909197.1 hypothetical protein N7495_001879 [Penicillium taxi]